MQSNHATVKGSSSRRLGAWFCRSQPPCELPPDSLRIRDMVRCALRLIRILHLPPRLHFLGAVRKRFARLIKKGRTHRRHHLGEMCCEFERRTKPTPDSMPLSSLKTQQAQTRLRYHCEKVDSRALSPKPIREGQSAKNRENTQRK